MILYFCLAFLDKSGDIQFAAKESLLFAGKTAPERTAFFKTAFASEARTGFFVIIFGE